MRYYLKNNHSSHLIVFFSGWGCDENMFANLHDEADVLIVYDYSDWQLDFDFTEYETIDIIAYSAGVFVASVCSDRIPRTGKKIVVCGNPYLFDEDLGISGKNIRVFRSLNLDNYLSFRREYMVETDEEYERYNLMSSQRSFESCFAELDKLAEMYALRKGDIKDDFSCALLADHDPIFIFAKQKDYYKNRFRVVTDARHHVFFRFSSFAEILAYGTI